MAYLDLWNNFWNSEMGNISSNIYDYADSVQSPERKNKV